jgi:hypothetical protein
VSYSRQFNCQLAAIEIQPNAKLRDKGLKEKSMSFLNSAALKRYGHLLRKRARHRALIQELVRSRPTSAPLETDVPNDATPIFLDRSNWVRMWVDPEHAVRSDCGEITARRGITWDGQMIWLVHHREKRHGYHAGQSCAYAAIEEAEKVWVDRRRVRQNWSFVQSLARDLLLGRRKLEVRIEDAHASALCSFGIEGFLKRIGLGRLRRTSGRVVALMMLLDDQAGFVILSAYERAHGPVPSEAHGAQSSGSRRITGRTSESKIVASSQRN